MIKLLKPVDGKVIPMPEYNYKPLPIEGMELPVNSYWNDRIKQGDVLVSTADKVVTPPVAEVEPVVAPVVIEAESPQQETQKTSPLATTIETVTEPQTDANKNNKKTNKEV